MGGLLHSPSSETINARAQQSSHALSKCTPGAGTITRIPPEILVEIFAICSVADPLSPHQLSLVNRYWHDLLMEFPRIWQRITLDERAHSIPKLRSQTELWITRSHPLPFDVDITVENVDNILSILSCCLQHVDRWRSCSIAKRDLQVPFVKEAPIEGLERLEVMIHPPHELTWEADAQPPQNIFPQFIPYSSVDNHVSMTLAVSILPKVDLLTPMRFSALDITEAQNGVPMSPRNILQFLQALPELEEFCFVGWTQEPLRDDEPGPMPVAFLPRLQLLSIRNTCSARALLSHLDCPNLNELELEHLNVEFELHHVNNLYEDGDSDDEAGDFSQSPWSDHATGMGLRNLIRRCSPPLEVLQMDYADMRTKDFEWVFDRLHELRVFRIVASDMSDKVIDLLRPCRPAFVPQEMLDDERDDDMDEDEDYDMGDDEDIADEKEDGQNKGKLRLRLPSLLSLDLSGCQRLSGEAIVSALHARDDFSLGVSNCSMTPLDEVKVFNCHRFTATHEAMLADVLGPKFKTGGMF